MTAVDTELTGRLDSKNAVVGQAVTAKTVQAAKLADGTALPKGTKLVGHVTRVQSSNKDQPYAVLAMVFDRAELKNGQSVALRSVVRTVAPPVSVASRPGGPVRNGHGRRWRHDAGRRRRSPGRDGARQRPARRKSWTNGWRACTSGRLTPSVPQPATRRPWRKRPPIPQGER